MSSAPFIDCPGRRSLRTVLIGLGRIGVGFHAVEIRRHPGFQLVGAADPLAERCAEAARDWGVPVYQTVDELLDAVRPEVAVIASPTAFHCEQARAAFNRGAHVLCDKPVARSAAEFDTVLTAAALAGRSFLAYQPHRVRPELYALQSLLRQGCLGPIHLIKRAQCNYARRNDWQAFRANSGGLLNNYASHFLDQAMALLGNDPITSVFCRTRCVATVGDAEDFVKIVLTARSGCLVDLDISQASAQPVAPWQVFGAHGAATWSDVERVWHAKYFRPNEAPPVAAQTGLAAEGRRYPGETLPWREETIRADNFPMTDYYELAWRYFVHGEPPPVTPQDSSCLLHLIERCRNSAAAGGEA